MKESQRVKGARKRSRSEPAANENVMVTTTIALDEETHLRLRHLAVEQRTTFRDLIRAAIREYLDRQKRGR
jgi:hypothetical protein